MSNTYGYDDTPFLPNSKYRVHDGNRPQPPVVFPGTLSTQESAGEAPSDAVVLFNGSNLAKWHSDKGDAGWKVENGYMEVEPHSGSIFTNQSLGDGHYHIEWASPAQVENEGQGRGNSGVFLMSLYEIQVLDSYRNPTYADGSAAAVYGQTPPLVNACRKPGEWQLYDIIWTGPEFDKDEVIRPAMLTMLHNNILVHYNTELIGPTTHKDIMAYKPHPNTAPLMLQDHNNRVRFRNIWYRPFAKIEQ
jgi:hypothetical protein